MDVWSNYKILLEFLSLHTWERIRPSAFRPGMECSNAVINPVRLNSSGCTGGGRTFALQLGHFLRRVFSEIDFLTCYTLDKGGGWYE